MASGFTNDAGIDFDDIYELVEVGQEANSIRNAYTGGDFIGTFVGVPEGQWVMSDGTDLIDRYVAVELGTIASATNNMNYLLVEEWTPIGGGFNEFEEIFFRDIAAAKGTAGQVPTWGASSSSKTGTFTGVVISDSITNNFTANGEGVPITGYRVANHTVTGSADLSTSSVTVNSSGTVTVNFDGESPPAGSDSATVTVYVEAQNSFGWSDTQHAHIFTITLQR